MRRRGRAYVFVCACARHDCVPFVCIITYIVYVRLYRVCMLRVCNTSLKGAVTRVCESDVVGVFAVTLGTLNT